MSDIQELREIVNPVFNTAKSCVQLDAASGDKDAQRLLEVMGLESFADHSSSSRVPPEMSAQIRRLTPAYAVLVESRFKAMNVLIEKRADRQVVDLPCGYTSRGIGMYRQGRTYVGLDLPAVIDVIRPATEAIIAEQDGIEKPGNVRYQAVDATNYESLAAALTGLTGELLITTEGLLMYFTQSELEEVFTNIHRLLERYGGSWVTTDRAYFEHDHDVAVAALGHDPQLSALYDAITARAASQAADVKFNNNVFFDADEDKVKQFIRDMGFELKLIPMSDYLPEHLGALESVPEVDGAVRAAFEKLFFWELSVSGKRESYEYHGTTFSVDGCVENKVFGITLRGRLDTLTSPELLTLFQGVDANSYRDIVVDLRDLEYISSAGLRVLLLMLKSLSDEGSFRVENPSDSVSQVLEMTGLGEFFE